MSGWYTPEDVARLTQYTPRTIQRWCREERIPHIRVGRLYRFTQAQLDEFVTAYTREPQERVEVDFPNPAYERSTPVVVPMRRPHPAA